MRLNESFDFSLIDEFQLLNLTSRPVALLLMLHFEAKHLGLLGMTVIPQLVPILLLQSGYSAFIIL
jgi:hypothetical protein